jgi:hypothetical protein
LTEEDLPKPPKGQQERLAPVLAIIKRQGVHLRAPLRKWDTISGTTFILHGTETVQFSTGTSKKLVHPEIQ